MDHVRAYMKTVTYKQLVHLIEPHGIDIHQSKEHMAMCLIAKARIFFPGEAARYSRLSLIRFVQDFGLDQNIDVFRQTNERLCSLLISTYNGGTREGVARSMGALEQLYKIGKSLEDQYCSEAMKHKAHGFPGKVRDAIKTMFDTLKTFRELSGSSADLVTSFKEWGFETLATYMATSISTLYREKEAIMMIIRIWYAMYTFVNWAANKSLLRTIFFQFRHVMPLAEVLLVEYIQLVRHTCTGGLPPLCRPEDTPASLLTWFVRPSAKGAHVQKVIMCSAAPYPTREMNSSVLPYQDPSPPYQVGQTFGDYVLTIHETTANVKHKTTMHWLGLEARTDQGRDGRSIQPPSGLGVQVQDKVSQNIRDRIKDALRNGINAQELSVLFASMGIYFAQDILDALFREVKEEVKDEMKAEMKDGVKNEVKADKKGDVKLPKEKADGTGKPLELPKDSGLKLPLDPLVQLDGSNMPSPAQPGLGLPGQSPLVQVPAPIAPAQAGPQAQAGSQAPGQVQPALQPPAGPPPGGALSSSRRPRGGNRFTQVFKNIFSRMFGNKSGLSVSEQIAHKKMFFEGLLGLFLPNPGPLGLANQETIPRFGQNKSYASASGSTNGSSGPFDHGDNAGQSVVSATHQGFVQSPYIHVPAGPLGLSDIHSRSNIDWRIDSIPFPDDPFFWFDSGIDHSPKPSLQDMDEEIQTLYGNATKWRQWPTTKTTNYATFMAKVDERLQALQKEISNAAFEPSNGMSAEKGLERLWRMQRFVEGKHRQRLYDAIQGRTDNKSQPISDEAMQAIIGSDAYEKAESDIRRMVKSGISVQDNVIQEMVDKILEDLHKNTGAAAADDIARQAAGIATAQSLGLEAKVSSSSPIPSPAPFPSPAPVPLVPGATGVNLKVNIFEDSSTWFKDANQGLYGNAFAGGLDEDSKIPSDKEQVLRSFLGGGVNPEVGTHRLQKIAHQRSIEKVWYEIDKLSRTNGMLQRRDVREWNKRVLSVQNSPEYRKLVADIAGIIETANPQETHGLRLILSNLSSPGKIVSDLERSDSKNSMASLRLQKVSTSLLALLHTLSLVQGHPPVVPGRAPGFASADGIASLPSLADPSSGHVPSLPSSSPVSSSSASGSPASGSFMESKSDRNPDKSMLAQNPLSSPASLPSYNSNLIITSVPPTSSLSSSSPPVPVNPWPSVPPDDFVMDLTKTHPMYRSLFQHPGAQYIWRWMPRAIGRLNQNFPKWWTPNGPLPGFEKDPIFKMWVAETIPRCFSMKCAEKEIRASLGDPPYIPVIQRSQLNDFQRQVFDQLVPILQERIDELRKLRPAYNPSVKHRKSELTEMLEGIESGNGVAMFTNDEMRELQEILRNVEDDKTRVEALENARTWLRTGHWRTKAERLRSKGSVWVDEDIHNLVKRILGEQRHVYINGQSAWIKTRIAQEYERELENGVMNSGRKYPEAFKTIMQQLHSPEMSAAEIEQLVDEFNDEKEPVESVESVWDMGGKVVMGAFTFFRNIFGTKSKSNSIEPQFNADIPLSVYFSTGGHLNPVMTQWLSLTPQELVQSGAAQMSVAQSGINKPGYLMRTLFSNPSQPPINTKPISDMRELLPYLTQVKTQDPGRAEAAGVLLDLIGNYYNGK